METLAEEERDTYPIDDKLRQSLVEIRSPKRKAIGCFVTPDTILTCVHVFQDVPLESIEVTSIYGKRQKYSVLSTSWKSEEYANTDLLKIAIKADSHDTLSCIEIVDRGLDTQSNDDFYIYHPSANGGDIVPIDLTFPENQSTKKATFSYTWHESIDTIGCPVLNKKNNKLYGIAILQSPRQAEIQKGIQVTGDVILLAEIVAENSEIRQKNRYINSLLHNLPDRDYNEFIGREAELKSLSQYLSHQHRQHITIISGVGGIGKTALAVEAAYRYSSSYKEFATEPPIFQAIVFVSLKNSYLFEDRYRSLDKNFPDVGLLHIIRVISDTLKVPRSREFLERESLEVVQEALLRKPTLLIIDGFDDLSASETSKIFDFLNSVPSLTKVIITTREEGTFYNSIALKALSESESENFIKHFIKQKITPIDNIAITSMATSVPGIPTALDLAISLDRLKGYSKDDYRKMSKEKSGTIDVARLYFEMLMNSLKNSDRVLLVWLSFFATSASQEAVMAAAMPENPENPVDLNIALNRLEQLGLLSKSSLVGFLVHSQATLCNRESPCDGVECIRQTRYSISSTIRKYTIAWLKSPSALDETFVKEARSVWVKWYRNFLKNPPDRLDNEWENINELLMWCAIEKDADTIEEIWPNIDKFIKRKQYWTIRFYWWQYLAMESLQRGEAKAYAAALMELLDTCLATGDNDRAKEYLDKVLIRSRLLSEANKARLEEYKLKLQEKKVDGVTVG